MFRASSADSLHGDKRPVSYFRWRCGTERVLRNVSIPCTKFLHRRTQNTLRRTREKVARYRVQFSPNTRGIRTKSRPILQTSMPPRRRNHFFWFQYLGDAEGIASYAPVRSLRERRQRTTFPFPPPPSPRHSLDRGVFILLTGILISQHPGSRRWVVLIRDWQSGQALGGGNGRNKGRARKTRRRPSNLAATKRGSFRRPLPLFSSLSLR